MLHLKVHHLGYLVKKKDAAQRAFLALGYRTTDDWGRDESRGVDICFMEKDGLLVELVCPYTDSSDVSGLMGRMKNSPYHICYSTPDYEADIAALREEGFVPVRESAPAPRLGGRDVIFLMHPAMGMVELVDSGDGD